MAAMGGQGRYMALTEDQVQEYESCGLDPEMIEKINQKEMRRMDKKLADFTISVLGPGSAPMGEELRLVLLGTTGVGKSETGNLILGKEVFKSSSKSISQTKTIQEGSTEVDGLRVRVIDTPGFNDTGGSEPRSKMSPREIVTEIVKVMDKFSDGIHGFLVFFNRATNRFTADQEQVFALLEKDLFGPHFLKRCFMVISHGDAMDMGLNDYIEEESKNEGALGRILKKTLDKRAVVVESKAEFAFFRAAQQVQVVRLVAASHEPLYTNNIHQQHRRLVLAEVDTRCAPLVPLMEAEYDTFVEAMTNKEIKAMDLSKKVEAITKAVDKVKGELAAATIPVENLRGVATKVLDMKIERLTGDTFFEKIKGFAITLLGMANQILPIVLTIVGLYKAAK